MHDPDALEKLAAASPLDKYVALRGFTKMLTNACLAEGIHPNHNGMRQFLKTEKGRYVCLEYIHATMFVAAVPADVREYVNRKRNALRNN